MVKTYLKRVNPDDSGTPLSWFIARFEYENKDRLFIQCPSQHRKEIIFGIEHWDPLRMIYSISENGEIFPSVFCQECGWHEYIVLEEWNHRHKELA